jgi:multicomponent Na+:H+ antiporter subunit A
MSLLVAVGTVFALAGALPAVTRWLGRNAAYLSSATLGGLAVWIAAQAGEVLGGSSVTAEVAWLPSVGISLALRLDALSVLFALIVLGIGAVVLAYSARYFAPDAPGTGRTLALLTLFAGSMFGLVVADDVIALFLFWELTGITSFFLIGGKGEGGKGATHALLVTSLGGLALLAGLTLLGLVADTTSLSAIAADPALVRGSSLAPAMIVLLLLSATTKSAQFPFHFWLPGAMVAPTPVSTYLHAATMVKAGIYLLLRFTPVFGGLALWRTSLVLVGLGTAVFGAVVAAKQHDLKALLAYSTISQLGFLTGLIGIGTPLALAAASLHVLAHALYKSALFMTVGIVEHQTGTRDLRDLGGLRRQLPVPAATAGLAAVSMAGIPPLLGFVSKEEAFAAFLVLDGATGLGTLAIALAVVASIGTVAYSARFYLGVFEGEPRGPTHAASPAFTAPPALVATTGLVLGLFVPLLGPLLNGVAAVTTGTDPDLQLALWHGPTLPLALSLVVVSVGTWLVVQRQRVQLLQDRVGLPAGSEVFDTIYDRALSLGRVVGRSAGSLAPAAYLYPIIAVLLVLGAGAATWPAVAIDAPPAPSLATDWAVVVLVAACVLGTIQAGSRLGAIAALGMTGFVVAGWFVLLGAPDLALTQLLVETLIVTVVVLVFRRLPLDFPRSGKRRVVSAGVTAAAVGLFAGLATYTFTGRRPISEVGSRFLAEVEQVTGASNVVNTILVDFRALDTLGEVAVLGVATLGIYALTRLVRHDPVPRPELTLPLEPESTHELYEPPTRPAAGTTEAAGRTQPSPATRHTPDHGRHRIPARLLHGSGTIESVILQTVASSLELVIVAASVWLLVRGHNAVGGGFIGGLTAGAAVVLFYFSHGHERVWRNRKLRLTPLVGAGLLIALLYGLAGLALGAGFLAGGKLVLGPVSIAASLVFDIGVYVVVIGMIVGIVRHLGQGLAAEEEAR